MTSEIGQRWRSSYEPLTERLRQGPSRATPEQLKRERASRQRADMMNALAMAAEVGLPIAGGVIGTLGGVPGAVAGAGIGAGAGQALGSGLRGYGEQQYDPEIERRQKEDQERQRLMMALAMAGR